MSCLSRLPRLLRCYGIVSAVCDLQGSFFAGTESWHWAGKGLLCLQASDGTAWGQRGHLGRGLFNLLQSAGISGWHALLTENLGSMLARDIVFARLADLSPRLLWAFYEFDKKCTAAVKISNRAKKIKENCLISTTCPQIVTPKCPVTDLSWMDFGPSEHFFPSLKTRHKLLGHVWLLCLQRTEISQTLGMNR